MVRQREEGAELSLCSYLSQCDALQRNDRRSDIQRIESRVADQGFWLQTGCAVKAFSFIRAGEPAAVTVDTTAVPRLVARACMNNPLLRESIWWRCIMGSMLMRSAKR